MLVMRYVSETAKIMPAGRNQACLRLPGCRLSYANTKIRKIFEHPYGKRKIIMGSADIELCI